MDPAGEGEQIRREMRDLRQEFDTDVARIVARARTLTDWRHHVRKHPWLCVGAAAAVGYLFTPALRRSRRLDLAEIQKLVEAGKIVQVAAPAKFSGLVGTLVGTAARSLVQTGIAVLSEQIGRMTQPAASVNPSASGHGANGNGADGHPSNGHGPDSPA